MARKEHAVSVFVDYTLRFVLRLIEFHEREIDSRPGYYLS